MKKNEVFEGKVVDLTHEGLGVVKYNDFPFFVENALPGEQVKVKITKIGKSIGFARVEDILVKSDARVDALNLDYLRTGIADLAHLSYDEQLLFKRKQVETVLSKSKIEVPVLEVIEASKTSAYRNKAQIPVRTVKGQLETGFFRKNSHDLLPIEDFFIQEQRIDEVILEVRKMLRTQNFIAYDETSGKGDIRNIILRRAHATGEIMLVLVVSHKIDFNFDKLLKKTPEIKSIQLSIKKDKGNAILGKEMKVLYGQDFIEDKLLGKTFRISAQSFYQVNTAQAELLYQKAYDFADLTSEDTIIDAYSGIGTIGICAADKVKKVYGMEVIPQAVDNAMINAELNQLSNVHYEVGTAEEVFPKWLEKGIKPDVIFVDPPRKGLTESFIQSVAEAKPRAVIYVSCNPATFARDVVSFKALGYELQKVQPVDLFPQTHHVECVAMLTKAPN